MSKKQDVSRRDFMRKAAKVTAGATVATTAASRQAKASTYKSIMPQSVMGANEKIRTGHIGVGNMGTRDLRFVMLRDDMQPIAVCDLFPKYTMRASQIVENKYDAPTQHTYFEELIENKDIDAMVVVTPDHWHTIPAIMAIEAGKDVYCEKPLCTTIGEAQAISAVVKNSKQVYQSGTMQRSGVYFQEAVQMIQEGYIGKVGRVECWNNDWAKIEGVGDVPDSDPPDWLDWDRYLGWTPKVPYNKNRYIYNFRWFVNYSGGKLTDWGAHLIDIALWAMGEDKKPRAVTAGSGNFILQDNRTTPDTLEVTWEFDDYLLSFSNRAWNPDWLASLDDISDRNEDPEWALALANSPGHGIMFHGTLGSMRVDRRGYEVFPFSKNGGCERVSKLDAEEMDMNVGHWQNFAECIRDRKDPICHVDVARTTATTCIMGKCAYLADAKLKWDAENERFTGGDAEAVKLANDWAYRDYQNGWSLKKPYYKDWA